MKASLKELISKMTDWIKVKNYTGYDSEVEITSYSSSSNYYTAPKDGIVKMHSYYTNGNYVGCTVLNSDGTNGQAYSVRSANTHVQVPVPIFKGQRVYVHYNSGSGNHVYFVGFKVGGVVHRLLKALQSLTLERGWAV